MAPLKLKTFINRLSSVPRGSPPMEPKEKETQPAPGLCLSQCQCQRQIPSLLLWQLSRKCPVWGSAQRRFTRGGRGGLLENSCFAHCLPSGNRTFLSFKNAAPRTLHGA